MLNEKASGYLANNDAARFFVFKSCATFTFTVTYADPSLTDGIAITGVRFFGWKLAFMNALLYANCVTTPLISLVNGRSLSQIKYGTKFALSNWQST